MAREANEYLRMQTSIQSLHRNLVTSMAKSSQLVIDSVTLRDYHFELSNQLDYARYLRVNS